MNTGGESRGAGEGNVLVRHRISGAIDSATSWRLIAHLDRNLIGISHRVSLKQSDDPECWLLAGPGSQHKAGWLPNSVRCELPHLTIRLKRPG